MAYRPDAALIVQSDGTILAEVAAPDYPFTAERIQAAAAAGPSAPAHLAGSAATPALRVARNERCPCGSGKKYKACCLSRDLAAAFRG